MDKLINVKTGDLKLNDSTTISCKSTKTEILDFKLTERPQEISYGNGWGWLMYDNLSLNGQVFSFGFSLFNDTLKSIHINFSDHLKYIKENSDDWTEKNELKRKDEYDKWLTEQIGSQRDFDWGQIGAFYHPKDGVSTIVLNYRDE